MGRLSVDAKDEAEDWLSPPRMSTARGVAGETSIHEDSVFTTFWPGTAFASISTDGNLNTLPP